MQDSLLSASLCSLHRLVELFHVVHHALLRLDDLALHVKHLPLVPLLRRLDRHRLHLQLL